MRYRLQFEGLRQCAQELDDINLRQKNLLGELEDIQYRINGLSYLKTVGKQLRACREEITEQRRHMLELSQAAVRVCEFCSGTEQTVSGLPDARRGSRVHILPVGSQCFQGLALSWGTGMMGWTLLKGVGESGTGKETEGRKRYGKGEKKAPKNEEFPRETEQDEEDMAPEGGNRPQEPEASGAVDCPPENPITEIPVIQLGKYLGRLRDAVDMLGITLGLSP